MAHFLSDDDEELLLDDEENDPFLPAALRRKKTATYTTTESYSCVTPDHEDHTFCGIMFDLFCRPNLLPVDYLHIESVAVRGTLGKMKIFTVRSAEEQRIAGGLTSRWDQEAEVGSSSFGEVGPSSENDVHSGFGAQMHGYARGRSGSTSRSPWNDRGDPPSDARSFQGKHERPQLWELVHLGVAKPSMYDFVFLPLQDPASITPEMIERFSLLGHHGGRRGGGGPRGARDEGPGGTRGGLLRRDEEQSESDEGDGGGWGVNRERRGDDVVRNDPLEVDHEGAAPVTKPLRVFPGEKVGLYVHSSGPDPDTDPSDHVTRFRDPFWVWNGRGGGTPDSIVYNNQRHAVTMENAHLRVMPGIAHTSVKPFSQDGFWGYGNAWRPYREFVGKVKYGVRYKLWNPEAAVHRQFPLRFRQMVLELLLVWNSNPSSDRAETVLLEPDVGGSEDAVEYPSLKRIKIEQAQVQDLGELGEGKMGDVAEKIVSEFSPSLRTGQRLADADELGTSISYYIKEKSMDFENQNSNEGLCGEEEMLGIMSKKKVTALTASEKKGVGKTSTANPLTKASISNIKTRREDAAEGKGKGKTKGWWFQTTMPGEVPQGGDSAAADRICFRRDRFGSVVMGGPEIGPPVHPHRDLGFYDHNFEDESDDESDVEFLPPVRALGENRREVGGRDPGGAERNREDEVDRSLANHVEEVEGVPAVRTDGVGNDEDSENEEEVDEAFREFLYRQQELSGEDEEDRRGTGPPRRRDQSFLPQPSSSSSSSSSSASEREEAVANAQSQAATSSSSVMAQNRLAQIAKTNRVVVMAGPVGKWLSGVFGEDY
eukprot:g6310.t1